MNIHSWFNLVASLMLIGYSGTAQADDLKRDYEATTPLPQTGRLTIRRSISALPADQLFDRCPAQSRLEEFAESTRFLVMVCRDDRDALKKFWIQKTKKTGTITRLTGQDQPRSQPTPFASGDYRVLIYADGAKPSQLNAYLESYNAKTRKAGRAEALLYHYSKFYDRRPR